MKKLSRLRKRTLLSVLLATGLAAHTQQKFSVTSSRANNYCNGTCTLLDSPDLNGNPTAVLFITQQQVNGINLDSHPFCAYYNGKQWSVMNTDNGTMPGGAQFNVDYFVKPDDTHFTHIVTKDNLVKEKSYIDHAGLNDNAAAVFTTFQNAAPNVRGGTINKDEIKTSFDAGNGKWYISNSNSKVLELATGYNISVSSGSTPVTSPVTTLKTLPTPVVSLAPAAFNPGPATDNSGQKVYISVLGKVQGQFPGEGATTKIELTNFEMENVSPRDLATGQASGKRQHLPVLAQKPTGPATAQFFKAFTSNEQLTTVTFEVYKPGTGGALIQDYKIVLGNATIANFKQVYAAEGQKGFVDLLKFTYQSCEVTVGGVTVSDTWPSIN